MKIEGTFKIEKIGIQSLEEVWEIYRLAKSQVRYGHLTERTTEEFAEWLSDPENSISLGVRHKGNLVAYSISSRERGFAFLNSHYSSHLKLLGEDLWVGKGTVVQKDYEGHRLMARLLNARKAIFCSRGISHSTGLIAVDNFSSLAGAFRTGSHVIDIVEDAYCLNFLCYSGPLINGTFSTSPLLLPIEDTSALRQHFADSWVGTKMQYFPKLMDRKMELIKIIDSTSNI